MSNYEEHIDKFVSWNGQTGKITHFIPAKGLYESIVSDV